MNQNTDKTKVKDAPKKTPQEEDYKNRLSEMEENWKRALADYKNLERRTAKEKADALKFANYVLISELIPVYDNLQTVQRHNDDEGIKMIVRQMQDVLQNQGVEKMKVEGEKFDESVMEAVETQECSEDKDGRVIEVLQTGYKFRGRTLKPARVIVGKAKEGGKENPRNKEDPDFHQDDKK